MLVDKQSELMSDLLFTVHQHGGDDVTWKPPIAMKFERMQIYFVIDDFTAVVVVQNTLQIFFRTDSFGLLDSVKEIKD